MTNIHCYSCYSYKKGISKVKNLVKATKDAGYNSFAITDLNSVTSYVKAFKLARENNMKFIPGCEFLIKPDNDNWKYYLLSSKNELEKKISLKRTTEEEKIRFEKELSIINEKLKNSVDYYSMIVLAKNHDGLYNIFNLFNKLENYEDIDLLSQEFITKEYCKDLICIFNIGSIMDYNKDNNDEFNDLLRKYENIFDSVYFDLNVKEFNNFNNINKVISNHIYYSFKYERDAFRLYYSMMNNVIETLPIDNAHVTNTAELKEKFNWLTDEEFNECIKNLNKIEEKVEIMKLDTEDSLQDFSKELKEDCIKGWEEKRKGTFEEKQSWDRLNYELSIIDEKNFSEYFINILEIIKTAKELNILIGPGRGSGCGSEICYLLDITKIDPLKYELYFERFLNPGRNNYPDIDIDFAAEINFNGKNIASRDLIITKLLEKKFFTFIHYISNEVEASTKVLFKSIQRYYDLSFSEANRITDNYEDKLEENEYTGWLKSACDELGIEYEDNWSIVESKMPLLYYLNNTPYNRSIAASGVIMSKKNPILPIKNDEIIFDSVDLESIGFIKYDLLSISSFLQVAEFEGLDLDWSVDENITIGDKTFKSTDIITLKNGETILVGDLYKRVQNGETFEI